MTLPEIVLYFTYLIGGYIIILSVAAIYYVIKGWKDG